MGDVAERPAVDERRPPLERLDEIGVDRVLQEQGQGAVGPQVPRPHGPLVGREPDHDAREALLQIFERGGERHDRHDLRARDDDEPLLARGTGVQAPEPDDDVAQGPVVHVDGAGPRDAARVEAEAVAVVEVGVEHRGEEVVRARDGMEVAREVQIDVLHRDHLRVAAAARASLHAEHRPERRLAHAEGRMLPELPERLGHAHRHGGLPLARGRGVDARDEDQAPLRLAARQRLQEHFRFVLAVQLDFVLLEAELGGDVGERAQPRGLGDRDVGRHLHGGHERSSTVGAGGAVRAPEATAAPKTRRAFAAVCRSTASYDSPPSSYPSESLPHA